MSPVSTIASGSPVRVTEPINYDPWPLVYVVANDATITATKSDGRAWFFAVKCDNIAQAEHVKAQMQLRDDLSNVRMMHGLDCHSASPVQLVPFRLLGRKWLEDWQETADRIEVREGPSGSLYIAVVTDGATVGEERIPANRDDKEERLSNFRMNYPAHALFDYR